MSERVGEKGRREERERERERRSIALLLLPLLQTRSRPLFLLFLPLPFSLLFSSAPLPPLLASVVVSIGCYILGQSVGKRSRSE